MSEKRQLHTKSSPVVQDRDAQLAAEANEWARGQVKAFFEANRTGFFLPGDILASLDADPNAPTAWIRWLSEYQTRYAMVRNPCVSLHKAGMLETRSEPNALGRESTSYQRARDLDDWTISVTPSDMSASVIDIAAGWLRSNPRSLKGVEAIVITRKSSTSNAQDQRGGTGSKAPAQPVQRRRGR